LYTARFGGVAAAGLNHDEIIFSNKALGHDFDVAVNP
jgi:hypothetical protein